MAGVIAVTGASGFIGRHLVRRSLADGWQVRALSRGSRPMPAPSGSIVVPGSLEDGESLVRLVRGADAVIHCAGLVRGASDGEFHRVNAAGVARLARIVARQSTSCRFILISSLAARAPEVSPYAASKLQGELELAREGAGLHWTVVRPPVVYGPGDASTLWFFRQLRRGVAPVPSPKDARFSAIFVEDLAAAIASLLPARLESGSIFEVHDGYDGGYSWRLIAAAAARELEKRCFCLRIPRLFMHLTAQANVARCRLGGGTPMITPGKVRELYHPDWVCRENPLAERTDWRPRVMIDEGFARTLAWYRENGWL